MLKLLKSSNNIEKNTIFPFYGKLTLKESGKSANRSMNVNKQSQYNTMQSDTRVKLRFGLGKALTS